jgi:hypothetical protein
VNFMNQHLSYMTIKGARKTDHPLSFSYHEPWWKSYNLLADYFGRLSVAMSLGAQENHILVLEPTTTGWMHYAPKGDRARIQAMGKGFQDFVNVLEAAQIEYDLGSERTIREFGKIEGNQFVLGQRSYSLVILPPTIDNLDRETFALLTKYLSSGGQVLCYGNPPASLDGRKSEMLGKLATQYGTRWASAKDPADVASIKSLSRSAVIFDIQAPQDPTQQLLFHQRRAFKDFELLFLVNTSDKVPVSGSVSAAGQGCEEWDAISGVVKPYPFRSDGGKLQMQFTLPRGGSLLLCLRPTEIKPGSVTEKQRATISSLSGPTVKRLGKNILTLDYCDLTIGGKTEKDLYFYQAQTKTFQFHGLQVNPWDHAVQYKKNIVEKDTFGRASGFEAAFPFTVAGDVKKGSLEAVIERPALYKVFVNGTRIYPLKNKWWLDKTFGVFDIGRHIREGENQIVLKSSPFTIHSELQPVFVLGDFGVEGIEKGFRIIPSAEMSLGGWSEHGMPFYGERVEYAKKYQLSADQLKNQSALVSLGQWRGALAEVSVNGKKVGPIAFEPFELDVSKYLKPGVNQVSVVVYGTLKNTLGPHHNNPPLGRAWPGSFQQGAKDGRPPGSEYSVVGYGLFEDFTLQLQKK